MAKNNLKFISAISPQAGNWYITTNFRKPVGAIRYSPVNGQDAGALIIRAFPFGFAKIKLTWSEFVPNKKTAEEAKNDDGSKKYQSYREFLNSNVVIGYRTEYVPFYKEVESHPHVVEVTSSIDGVSTEIVIIVIIKINQSEKDKPLKILSLDDPFGYVNGFINEAIVAWAADKTSKEIRSIDTDSINGITISGEYYLTNLNRDVFSKYDIEVTNVNLKMVVVAESSKKVIEAEQKVPIAEAGAQAAVFEKETRLELNRAQAAENDTALKLIQGELKAKEEFITGSANALEQINSGYAKGTNLTTLVMGGNNELINQLIAATKVANAGSKT